MVVPLLLRVLDRQGPEEPHPQRDAERRRPEAENQTFSGRAFLASVFRVHQNSPGLK